MAGQRDFCAFSPKNGEHRVGKRLRGRAQKRTIPDRNRTGLGTHLQPDALRALITAAKTAAQGFTLFLLLLLPGSLEKREATLG